MATGRACMGRDVSWPWLYFARSFWFVTYTFFLLLLVAMQSTAPQVDNTPLAENAGCAAIASTQRSGLKYT